MKNMQPNQRSHQGRTIFLFAMIMTVALLLVGQCPQPGHAQDLPSGEKVMASHIEKTGGQAAYDKIKTRVSQSTLEIVGQGISLDFTTWAARPNKTLVIIDSELTGKIEKGCDGETVWENSLVSGPVVRDGVQRATGLRDSTFERFAEWQSVFESAECTGQVKVGEADCYEVVLTSPKTEDTGEELNPMHLFVDTTSFLILKIEATVQADAGEIEVVAWPEDYREVDGILIAHKLRMEMMGQNREVTINQIEHNVDIPENTFDLPAEIQELLK